MFEAFGHALVEGHLDLSFRDTDQWPRVGPDPDMPPSLFVSLGDPVAGPDVQFVAVPPPPHEMWLDAHYHATDQFRAVIQGEFKIQRRCMAAGDFGYQSPGIPYREGFSGGNDRDLWMLMVHGERRGARSTMTGSDGNIIVSAYGDDQLDRPVSSPDDAYWDDVPGGPRGRSGLATTIGRQVGGFSWANFSGAGDWPAASDGVTMAAALLGDPIVGPIVLSLRLEPEARVELPLGQETEAVLTVVRGRCHMGGSSYSTGQVRIQTGRQLAFAADADPTHIVLVVADRRAVLSSDAKDPFSSALRGLLTEKLMLALPPA